MYVQHWTQRLLLGAALTVISLGALGAELAGKVVAIADGDTLTILDRNDRQHRIRLAAIDAPERGQPHWKASKQFLAGRAFSQWVSVKYGRADRYGRLVGRVLRDGQDINLEMVLGGAAWFYRKYEGTLGRPRPGAALEVARKQTGEGHLALHLKKSISFLGASLWSLLRPGGGCRLCCVAWGSGSTGT